MLNRLVYCSINTITMAEAILLRIQGARRIRLFKSSNVQMFKVLNANKIHIRSRKTGISFLSLESPVKNIACRSERRYGTCRTPRAFVCPDVKVPSKELTGSGACNLFAPKKSFSQKGISALVNFFLSFRLCTTKGTPHSSFVEIDSNLSIPLLWYLWNSTPGR